MKAPEIAAEVMKALRTRWMSPYQLAREIGIEGETALKWTRGLAENGLLVSRRNVKFKAETTREFMVAPAWRGAA